MTTTPVPFRAYRAPQCAVPFRVATRAVQFRDAPPRIRPKPPIAMPAWLMQVEVGRRGRKVDYAKLAGNGRTATATRGTSCSGRSARAAHDRRGTAAARAALLAVGRRPGQRGDPQALPAERDGAAEPRAYPRADLAGDAPDPDRRGAQARHQQAQSRRRSRSPPISRSGKCRRPDDDRRGAARLATIDRSARRSSRCASSAECRLATSRRCSACPSRRSNGAGRRPAPGCATGSDNLK